MQRCGAGTGAFPNGMQELDSELVSEERSMAASPIIAGKFQLERAEEGVLTLRWAESSHVTVEDVWALVDSMQPLSARDCSLMLVDLNSMVTLTRQALNLLAGLRDVPIVAAVGRSPVEKVLITHFQAVHRPSYLIEYFEDRDEALAWLHQQPIAHLALRA
ncbi:hypothetical protein D6T63_17040 [Arthrobacter cheniae]|uniref:DUF7793 domain-containing protein n=2 Tax=Arthrobacter cheniae TaxID=1258888 RepID=A0A3A5LZM8_9MICC|nr:hypothetical protein D6T63_17040 [Arthrobacter cheniae]